MHKEWLDRLSLTPLPTGMLFYHIYDITLKSVYVKPITRIAAAVPPDPMEASRRFQSWYLSVLPGTVPPNRHELLFITLGCTVCRWSGGRNHQYARRRRRCISARTCTHQGRTLTSRASYPGQCIKINYWISLYLCGPTHLSLSSASQKVLWWWLPVSTTGGVHFLLLLQHTATLFPWLLCTYSLVLKMCALHRVMNWMVRVNKMPYIWVLIMIIPHGLLMTKPYANCLIPVIYTELHTDTAVHALQWTSLGGDDSASSQISNFFWLTVRHCMFPDINNFCCGPHVQTRGVCVCVKGKDCQGRMSQPCRLMLSAVLIRRTTTKGVQMHASARHMYRQRSCYGEQTTPIDRRHQGSPRAYQSATMVSLSFLAMGPCLFDCSCNSNCGLPRGHVQTRH